MEEQTLDTNKDITLEDLRDNYAFSRAPQDLTNQPTSVQSNGQAEMQDGGMQGASATLPASDNAGNGSVTSQNVPQSGTGSYDAAMRIAEQNEMLRDMQSQNAALQAEIERLRSENTQNAQQAAGQVAEVLTGSDEIPVFDGDRYNFASDAERAEIMNEYTRALVDYAAKKTQADILNRVAPLVDEYDRTVENAAFDNALKELGTSPDFTDIGDYGDDIRRLCAREEFKGMKPFQRVTVAALLARGMHASPAAKANNVPDIGKQADDILANEALMRELETRKARKVHDAQGNYPVQSASGGLSAAAFEPPKKAQSIEELRSMYHGI